MFVRIGRYANDEDNLETFEREEHVVIHRYDTWSMDHTLALIIVPMLKQLQETKHGAPFVDMDDRPEHLHAEVLKYEEDEHHFEAWDWVLNEMIWAFEQIVDDNDGEFYDLSEVDDNEEDISIRSNQIKVDHEGLKKYHDRIDNGTRLFGKYYRSLWD